MRRNEAQFAEQRAAVYEMRVRGLTLREISQGTGTPLTTVQRWVSELTSARVRETQSEVLAMELDRLDRYLAKLELRLEARPQDLVSLLPLLLKVSERRAKLLGLDAAVKVDATVHEVTQQDLYLAELIRDAEAKAALDEQQIKELES